VLVVSHAWQKRPADVAEWSMDEIDLCLGFLELKRDMEKDS
jgi:hypothetical protein